ncbi:DinB family protein [Mesobacillus boroniphilus]|uniref:DinB family protein n=2 Tax=Mesobacillus boroniphilus TaxID=308892 RepID=A0A944GV94_9BACI|nr:DinB family protein [Mesobacillus boroniphilus]
MKQHYTEFDVWVKSLRDITDTEWQMPLGEGKWSVAAVVAHLLFWDKYSLEERFPYFKEGAVLPSYPDFQGVNDRAREYAEKTATKDQVLDELLVIRKEYRKMLDQMDSDKLAVSFNISDNHMTVGAYLIDFIQHDLHHQKQVGTALGRTLVK